MFISRYKTKKHNFMSDSILDDDILTNEGKISAESKRLLVNTGKWAFFLSIMSYIFLGIIILAFLISILTESSNPYVSYTGNGILGFFIFLIIGVLIVIPTNLLFNFSKKIKKATQLSKDKDYESAFDYLKRNFVFIGSTTFVCIIIYLLIQGYLYMNSITY